MSKKLTLLWACQFIAILIFLAVSEPLSINTDLSQLLPQPKRSPQLTQIVNDTTAITQNNNVILVEAENLEKVIKNLESVEKWLSKREEIAFVRGKFDIPSTKEIAESLAPYKHYILSPDYIASLKTKELMFEHYFGLLNQFTNPFVADSFKLDPSLSLADYLMSLPQSTSISSKNGFLYVKSGQSYYGFMFFSGKESGLALAASAQFVKDLRSELKDKSIEANFLGQIFYAEFAFQNAQFEMTLFSALSALAVSILIVVAYRSISSLLFTLGTITISLVYGWFSLNVFFEEVHILAFVFAVTLIGIGADYCFHVATHLRFSSEKARLRSIIKPLLLGLLSTIIGYIVLSFSPFPLFAQVSVFVIAGLVGALCTSLCLGPLFIKAIDKPLSIAIFSRFSLSRWQGSGLFKVSMALVCIFVVFGATQIKLVDDVRSYYQVSESLRNAELLVARLMPDRDDFQFFIVQGGSEQEALSREVQLGNKLNNLISNQELKGYKALSQYVPTEQQQLTNKALISRAMEQGVFEKTNSQLGVKQWDINSNTDALTVSKWLQTPIGATMKNQWVENDADFFSIVKLSGVTNSQVLNDICKTLEGCVYIDQANAASNQLTQFRNELSIYLIVSLFFVWLLLIKVFGMPKASKLVLLSLLAVAIAMVVSQYLQGYINIFNIMATVLIIALGLDYGIFYSEFGLSRQLNFTLSISALSSIFVFAILIMSNTPAIKSFGTTVFIGILATYLMAPLSASSKEKHEQSRM